MKTVLCVALALGMVAAGDSAPTEEGVKMTIQITSSAFTEGQPIPRKHTCDGPDVSPPLAWIGIREGAKSLALVCDDPDAPMGTWVHWVLFNLPADSTSLAENVPKTGRLENGAKQGMNDFRRLGYGGPCPPPGKPHRYFFKFYALDTVLDLKEGASKKDLEKAMRGHVLAEARLVGTYGR